MSDLGQPTIPDYSNACTSRLIPELIKVVMGAPGASWLPSNLAGAKQIVLLVLDGLGWNQLQANSKVLPTLAAFEGGPISTAAPTTTVVGLTTLLTGQPPAVHGIVGHRVKADNVDKQFDVLGWKIDDEDVRDSVVPEDYQRQPAFAANEVPTVTRKMFDGTGFTRAHMQGAKLSGYSVLSSLPVEVWRLAKDGEQFIYAYYEGIDTIAHDKGFGEHYEAELYTVDRLIRDLLAGLPEGAALVVTSDHGQVSVGDQALDIDQELVDMCSMFSGEGRFRWLHANQDVDVEQLAEVARRHYGELAWVKTRHEVIAEGWLGPRPSDEISARLGDVALVAAKPVAFRDPGVAEKRAMICRHGSLTDDEVLVPLVATRV